MKHLFPTLTFLLISSFTYSQSTLCGKHKKFNTSLKSNSLSLNQIAETELYDVHFYHLDLNMTNLSTALSGTVRMDASANESLDSALYELFSGYTITEIRVNGNTVDYSRNNSAIKVPVNADKMKSSLLKRIIQVRRLPQRQIHLAVQGCLKMTHLPGEMRSFGLYLNHFQPMSGFHVNKV
jgi:hypothetical protein